MLLIGSCALTICAPVSAAPEMRGRAIVVDGDTIDIGKARVRLWGVDAPEARQQCTLPDGRNWPCGTASAQALRTLIGASEIHCRVVDRDPGGRAVARCMIGARDIAGLQINAGWLLDYPRYSNGAYRAGERVARTAGRGIWRGTITPPWEWRAAQRRAVPAQTNGPDGCRLKGNIGSEGRHIVHSPGQRDYESVRIDTSRGERWFCTLDQAAQAGWRPAAR